MKAAATGSDAGPDRTLDESKEGTSVVPSGASGSAVSEEELIRRNMTAQDSVLVTALVLFKVTGACRADTADRPGSEPPAGAELEFGECLPLAGAMLLNVAVSGGLLHRYVPTLPRSLIQLCLQACEFLEAYDEDASEDFFGCSNIVITINHLHALLDAPEPLGQPMPPRSVEPPLVALMQFDRCLRAFMVQTPAQRLTNDTPLNQLYAAVFQLATSVAPHQLPTQLVLQLLEALRQPVEVYAELELDYALRVKLQGMKPAPQQQPQLQQSQQQPPPRPRPMQLIRAILSLLPHAEVFAFARRTQFLDNFSGVSCTVLKILSSTTSSSNSSSSSDSSNLPSSPPHLGRQQLSLILTQEHVSDLYVNFTPASESNIKALKTVSHGVFDLAAAPVHPTVVPFSRLQYVMPMEGVAQALQEPGKIRMAGARHPLYRGMPLFFLTPLVKQQQQPTTSPASAEAAAVAPAPAPLSPALNPSDSLYGMLRFTFPIRHFLEQPFGKHWYALGSRQIEHTLFAQRSSESADEDHADALPAATLSVSREFAHTILLSEHPAFSLGNPTGTPGIPSPCDLATVPHALGSGSMVEWQAGSDDAQWRCGRTDPRAWDQLKFAVHLPQDSFLVFEAGGIDGVRIDFVSHTRACAVLKGQHDGAQCACDVKEAMALFVEVCERAQVNLERLRPCFSPTDFENLEKLRAKWQQTNSVAKPDPAAATATSTTLPQPVALGSTNISKLMTNLQLGYLERESGLRQSSRPSPLVSLTPAAIDGATATSPAGASASLLPLPNPASPSVQIHPPSQTKSPVATAAPSASAAAAAPGPGASVFDSAVSPVAAGIVHDILEYDDADVNEYRVFQRDLWRLLELYLQEQRQQIAMSQPSARDRPFIQCNSASLLRSLAQTTHRTQNVFSVPTFASAEPMSSY